METLRLEHLLARAAEAADPKTGLLYSSYEDLQEILGQVSRAAYSWPRKTGRCCGGWARMPRRATLPGGHPRE